MFSVSRLMAILLLPVSITTAKNCLLPDDTRGRDVPFLSNDSFPSLPNGTQVIITSYQFHCYGNITAWYLYLPGNSGVYTIALQVWKPSQEVTNDGCYGLVGENTFSGITPATGEDGELIQTLEPSDIITVSPGDVVGYYAYYSQTNEDTHAKNVIQLDGNYTEESVWYHTNTIEEPLVSSGPPDTCLFAVGPQPNRAIKSFTNAAPILSLNMIPLMGSVLSYYPPTRTISPTNNHHASTYPVLPTHVTTGFEPRSKQNYRDIIIIALALVAMFILIFIIIGVIIIAIKRKKKKREQTEPVAASVTDPSEPLYANIEEPCDPDEIRVVPNELYAMISSHEISYGSMNPDDTELSADNINAV